MRTIYEIQDELREHGTLPSTEEVNALCESAITGDTAADSLAAVMHAIERAGWTVTDLTTDDTEGQEFMLVPPEVL